MEDKIDHKLWWLKFDKFLTSLFGRFWIFARVGLPVLLLSARVIRWVCHLCVRLLATTVQAHLTVTLLPHRVAADSLLG